MPTYDYKCTACKHAFELFHSMSEVKRKCPECGKNSLERQIGTGGAVIFKGSGFYQTDYRSESYKKGAESEKGATGQTNGEPKTAKPDGPKSDAPKAEPKPETKPKSEAKAQKPEKPAKKAS